MLTAQRVVMPVTTSVSWTVLGGDGVPLAPVETYLAYLSALERSPNTQRAYATSLKLWFDYLERTGRSWAEVDLDDVARFVSWLRAPADSVVVLEGGTGGALDGASVTTVRPRRGTPSTPTWRTSPGLQR